MARSNRSFVFLFLSAAIAASDAFATEVTVDLFDNRPGIGTEVSQYISPLVHETEVHVIGIYEPVVNATPFPPELTGDDVDQQERFAWWQENVRSVRIPEAASVRVQYDEQAPMQPITIALSAYEPTIWEFDIDEGVQIESIILNGFHEQTATNIGDIPVTNLSPLENAFAACAIAWPLDTEGCDTPSLVRGVEEIMDTKISSFTGTYAGSEFTVTGRALGAEFERPATGAGNLIDGPNADLVYYPETGAVAIDLSDLSADPLGLGLAIDFSVFRRLSASIGNYDNSFNPEVIDFEALDPIGFAEGVAESDEISIQGLITSPLPDPNLVQLGPVLPAGIADASELQQYLSSAFFSTGFQSGELDLVISTEPIVAALRAREIGTNEVDNVCAAIAIGSVNPSFDLNGDEVVDMGDLEALLSGSGHVAADLNLDGAVDFADFLTLSDNYGSDARHSGGDLTCDGTVSFEDFLVIADNFGPGSEAVAVPEPCGVVYLAWMLVALPLLRGRR